VNWKKLREQEAEECLARWRDEHAAEEGFDVRSSEPFVKDLPVTKDDFNLSGTIAALEAAMLCNESDCEHLDCALISEAINHLVDYSYLREAVRAHRAIKQAPRRGEWEPEDRRLWDLVDRKKRD
jgi:hypothetical protein